MLALVRKGLARQAAYEMVQRNALAARVGGRQGTFRALLGADADIARACRRADIDRAFDLEHHLRHAGAIIDRALAATRQTKITRTTHDARSSVDTSARQLGKTLDATDFPELGDKYEGKVRDCYIARRPAHHRRHRSHQRLRRGAGHHPVQGAGAEPDGRLLVRGDRRPGPNHVISVPDPQVMVARECKLLPVEFVMRAYLTGVTSTSIWSALPAAARARFCGHALPDGMKKNQRLPKALLTPSTKAEKGDHDESVVARRDPGDGRCWRRPTSTRRPRCARGCSPSARSEAPRRGLILVDTKYEIGRRPDGKLCFIDEIHTPDSSRYWYADDYEARFAAGEEPRGLDKEYVRRTLADQGYTGDGPPPPLTDEVRVEAARRYIQVCELITGRPFVPDTDEPIARIRRNLKLTTRSVRAAPRRRRHRRSARRRRRWRGVHRFVAFGLAGGVWWPRRLAERPEGAAHAAARARSRRRGSSATPAPG